MDMLKIAYEIGQQLAYQDAGVAIKVGGWLSNLFGLGEHAGGAEFKAWQKAKPFAQREAENLARARRIEQARSAISSTMGQASGGSGRALAYGHAV